MAITGLPPAPEGDNDHHQSQQGQQPQPSHPPHSLHQHSLSNASTVTVDIEAWTVAALESLSIAPIARGTGNALSIPLDGDHVERQSADNGRATQMKLRGVAFGETTGDAYGASITPPRRPPSRRDSTRKRETLHRGKEGSRQRRRWENDRLLHVPNVQPPLPCDWHIHPTHRVLPPVPYQLAQYWDKGLRERAEAHRNQRREPHTAAANSVSVGTGAGSPSVGHIPRDLRATAKRTPAVKSWLRVLEEPVRRFVVERGLAVAATTTSAPAKAGEAARGVGESSSGDETDPDDEEIVFVGRSRRMRDGNPYKKAQRQLVPGSSGSQQQQQLPQQQEQVGSGMVLDTMGDDAGGAFKRWLTHSISDYYGLDSKSVMVGNPARRVVYVGVKQKQPSPRQKPPGRPVLPPPLWEMF